MITPKKEKQKSPSQLIQSSESPISSSSPQITAFTEKKPLYISKVFETYTIQDKEIEDSPSVHEMKQTQHLNEITTEHQKLSQMITSNKEKQKSPLQLSQTSKNPISSTPPQVVTAFPEEKQSRFPQIFEALSEQQDFHPEGHAVTQINDSGIAAENSLSVIEKDDHILTKHSKDPTVEPLLKINSKDQDREISKLRKEAIRKFNMDLLEKGESDFMRERKSGKADGDTPVMCSGCFGFFAKSYKVRHQLICPSSGTNVMLLVVSIEKCTAIDKYCDEFKELLSKLLLDEIAPNGGIVWRNEKEKR